MEIEFVHFQRLQNFKRASQSCRCRSRLSYSESYKILMMSSWLHHEEIIFASSLHTFNLHLFSVNSIYFTVRQPLSTYSVIIFFTLVWTDFFCFETCIGTWGRLDICVILSDKLVKFESTEAFCWSRWGLSVLLRAQWLWSEEVALKEFVLVDRMFLFIEPPAPNYHYLA